MQYVIVAQFLNTAPLPLLPACLFASEASAPPAVIVISPFANIYASQYLHKFDFRIEVLKLIWKLMKN